MHILQRGSKQAARVKQCETCGTLARNRPAVLSSQLGQLKGLSAGDMVNSGTSSKVFRSDISFIWIILCQKSMYRLQDNIDLLDLKLWPMDLNQSFLRVANVQFD